MFHTPCLQSSRCSAPQLIAACGLGLSLFAGTAAADLPGVVDRIPEEAAFLVAPSMNGLADELSELTDAYASLLPPGVSGEMVEGFLLQAMETPGIDKNGSLAFVILPDAGEVDPFTGEPMPTGLALLPIRDFDAFLESEIISALGPQRSGGMVTMPNFMGAGEIFLRDLGGYVVAGDIEDAVQEFDGKPGRERMHERRLGAFGMRVVEANDFCLVTPVESAKDHIDEMLIGIRQQAQMAAMMMGNPQQAESSEVMFELLEAGIETLKEDGEVTLVGLQLSEAGVSFDFGANFKAGSDTAKMFDATGNSMDLLGRVQRMNFLAAGAIDLRNPAIREFIGAVQAASGEAPDLVVGREMLSITDGMAFVMGETSLFGGGGLLANTLTYSETSKPAELREMTQSTFEEMDGEAPQEGVKINSLYKEEAASIAGYEVDGFQMTFEVDPSGDPMLAQSQAQMMGMMFGPAGGPGGYIAQTDTGVYTTYSKSRSLLSPSLRLADGKGGRTLVEHAGIEEVAEHLPDNPMAVGFLGVDQIINAVGPLMMMFGMASDFEQTDAIPPIGAAMAAEDGGMVMRVHVPKQVIETISEMIPDDDFGGGFDDDMDFDNRPGF